MKTDEFDYNLPAELIAQRPLTQRDRSRLMVLDRSGTKIYHRHFCELPKLLRSDDVLVFNDTRVIPARLHGRKRTGGKIEVLLVRQLGSSTWEALVRPGVRPGQRLILEGHSPAQTGRSIGENAIAANDRKAVINGQHNDRGSAADRVEAVVQREGTDGCRIIEFDSGGDELRRAIWQIGQMPTPPYVRSSIERPEDYQTVYSRIEGSIAAPTAGFHFTKELLSQLREEGIALEFLTLHVGLGTFKPVKVAEVTAHRMHEEWYEVGPPTAHRLAEARRAGRRIVAVGTTTVRALESSVDEEGSIRPSTGPTDLFIYPGFRFQAVDALITNFHLPRSTLLMLVSAFAGRELVLEAYAAAIAAKYRFYSFGDAMLIT